MSISDLPNVSFVETDVSIIYNNVKSNFESALGRNLYPGDPLLLLIKTFATLFSQQASLFEYVAKQNLVKYSDDDYIENLGALVGVSRLQPASALVTLKFTISEVQTSIITIPIGTRVTTGNKIYFETTEIGQFAIGKTEVIVNSKCQVAGAVGNDFSIGQINAIVDPFPYFQSVINTTVSNSGSDLESLESFRDRIFEAPNSYSVAGPISAYKFWAKSTNALISDVSVYSPTPGVVEIIPLLENGELPSDEILQEVYDFCSADYRRPLTDFVEVKAPIEKAFNISLSYYVSKNNGNVVNEISAKVSTAIHEYILWQKASLGKDINPSKLNQKLMETGIKRVEINEPIFQTLEYDEVAIGTVVNISYGGLENE